jgi:hypothetical protein
MRNSWLKDYLPYKSSFDLHSDISIQYTSPSALMGSTKFHSTVTGVQIH